MNKCDNKKKTFLRVRSPLACVYSCFQRMVSGDVEGDFNEIRIRVAMPVVCRDSYRNNNNYTIVSRG